MMTITISDLTFECIIGILDFERRQPQKVIIDAALDYDYTPEAFLDYAAVAELIKTEMIAQEFELVEEALEHLFRVIKSRFPLADSLFLSISKPDILPDCRVCVSKKSNF
jgi:7,8-dihydroneopterin aldolase/epimerase/oxygenase